MSIQRTDNTTINSVVTRLSIYVQFALTVILPILWWNAMTEFAYSSREDLICQLIVKQII